MGLDGGGAVHLQPNEDRYGRERKVFGVMPFSVKVSGADTEGQLLVIEQHNEFRGGPPRHVHAAQEEWFYVVEGVYRVEVDGRTYELGPGGNVLAPRGSQHTWALAGNGPGRMLIAFRPAGDMEAFFDEACELEAMPPAAEAGPLFARHGMQVVGPPLSDGPDR